MPARVGVLSPLLGGAYFGAVLSGIRDDCERHRLGTLAVQTFDATPGDGHFVDYVLEAEVGWDLVDGFVVVIHAVTDDYLLRLQQAGKPVVLVSHSTARVSCPVVNPDNASGVREAVDHLLGHGHRRVGFVGDLSQPDVRDRLAALRTRLQAHGIALPERHVVEAPNMMESGGRAAGEALLAAGCPVSAVLVGNDLGAIGVVGAVRAAGRSVPDDLAVVGFDDSRAGAYHDPPLATVRQDFGALGALAAQVLRGELVREGPQVAAQHVLPTTFVPRATCGCGGTATPLPAPGEGGVADVAEVRQQLVRVLAPRDGRERVPTETAFDAVVDSLRRAAGTAAPPLLPQGAREALQALLHAWQRPEAAGTFLRSVQSAARAVLAADRAPAGETHGGADAARRVDELVAQLSDLLGMLGARTEVERGDALHSALRSEYDVSTALLQGDRDEVTSLQWLQMTAATAGRLGLWGADGGLEPAGAFERGGPPRADGPDAAPVRRFPDAAFVDAATPDECAVVLPVVSGQRDWGLLALRNGVERETVTGRGGVFHWAALLGVALDREAMGELVRRSEERYALATRATNDALWDWDVESGEVYYSPRWAAMVGSAATSTLEEWTRRVHPSDLPALAALLARCRDGAASAFELEHRVRGDDGSDLWVLCRAIAVPGPGDRAQRVVGSMADVTQRRALEDQLRQAALFDTVTGLPNKALFLDRLRQAIAVERRDEGRVGAVLFLDLDDFKVVNDSLGHLAGDQLLVEVGRRLSGPLRGTDTAARFGGDEFAILLTDLSGVDAVQAVVERLRQALDAPAEVAGQRVAIRASIGITTGLAAYDRPEDVLRDADIAMYRAKRREPGTQVFFDASMRATALDRMRLETELRAALEGDELTLFYQPIVDLPEGRLVGAEALVRWLHPRRGVVGPGDFLTVAEETGLVVPMGQALARAALATLEDLEVRGLLPDRFQLSLNVSHREFWHAEFPDRLLELAGEHPAAARRLTLEITEGVIMRNSDAAADILTEVKGHGFRLHVDDFGTGHSSLQTLHRFPIDALKIDRSFVAGLGVDRRSNELVRTIVSMGRNLGLDVIAEGIETAAQARIVAEMGCSLGQGFRFSRPVPAEALRPLLPAADGRSAAQPRLVEGLPSAATNR